MSDAHSERGARRRHAGRLAALLAVLAALVLFLTLHGPLQRSSGSTTTVASAPCEGQRGAPQVRPVEPRQQSALRDAVARVVPERVARLYEEGSVQSRSAWTDEEPAPPPVSPTAPRPGGYEMRWWAPNGDDVVADVFTFADASLAQRFLGMASSTRCRSKASTSVPAAPPQAVNLTWLNPDDAAQADVFLRDGARVYRVADAPAGQHGGEIRAGSLTHAFLTVDALACLLPGAHCSDVARNAIPS